MTYMEVKNNKTLFNSKNFKLSCSFDLYQCTNIIIYDLSVAVIASQVKQIPDGQQEAAGVARKERDEGLLGREWK